MTFPKSVLSQKPSTIDQGYEMGGGWVVSCPTVHRNGVNSERPQAALEFSRDEVETAKMVCAAINEKLERDFCNGGS